MRLLVSLLALAAACAPQIKHRDPATRLDRAVFYREQDLGGGVHPLSSGGDAVERVPDPGEVDVNSTIRIRLLKGGLLPPRPGDPAPPELAPLDARRRRIVRVLQALEGYLAGRQKAIEAYGGASDEAFFAALREHGKQSRAVLDEILALWPGDAEVDKAWSADRRTLRPFQDFLQKEIDALDAQYRRAAETLKTRGVSLRLEAFLDSPGAAPAALHLPGYDTLEARRVHVHDRFGLALDAREEALLSEALEASREIAGAAGRVLRREESIAAAFAAMNSGAARRIADLVVEADALARELPGLKDRLLAAAADLKTFGESLPAEGKAALEKAAASLAAAGGVDFPGFVAGLRTLRENPAATVRTAVENREALLKAVEEAPAKVAAALKDAALAKWEASDAKKRVDELERDVRRAAALVRKALAVLGFQDLSPVAAAIRVPEALDVPLAEAPDTGIDLTRSARLPGDTVTVRATLLQEGQARETSEASFVVREFGWHADLEPGVVLLSPLEGPNHFEFAPEVSWLWRHHPRPEQTGVLHSVSRFLQPSVGLHASFPNFDPDKEVEIGLGVSAAFWGDRVVLGAGYNLMHEGDDRDGVYYFVGTSLIPILQSLGLAGGASAGEKP